MNTHTEKPSNNLEVVDLGAYINVEVKEQAKDKLRSWNIDPSTDLLAAK